MKGFRTVGINAAIIGVSAILQYAVGVDWKQFVSPETALIIMSILNIGLRLITTTPIGKKEKE